MGARGRRSEADGRAGSELRGTRRLIAACVIALAVAGAGLVLTARDVANWIDRAEGEADLRHMALALEWIAAARPELSQETIARGLAGDLSLPGARIAHAGHDAARELALSLPGGAQLVWTAPRRGQEAYAHFASTRMPLILGSVFVVAVLLFQINRLAGALDAERRHARALAGRDALTGLGNRLAFDEALARRLAAGMPFTLLCLDLDGFKGVNDGYGHAAGDAVLRDVGSRLLRLLRDDDDAYRLGGDEFALLVAAERDAPRLARKVMLALGEAFELGPDAEAKVGVSIGIATAGAATRSPGELLAQADAALYLAKAETGSASRSFERPAPMPGEFATAVWAA